MIKKSKKWLKKAYLKKWNELAPIFAEKNMLNEADLSAFELLCLHYGDAMNLYEAMINEGGSIAGYLWENI